LKGEDAGGGGVEADVIFEGGEMDEVSVDFEGGDAVIDTFFCLGGSLMDGLSEGFEEFLDGGFEGLDVLVDGFVCFHVFHGLSFLELIISDSNFLPSLSFRPKWNAVEESIPTLLFKNQVIRM